jgi:hypothetical protein
VAWLPHFPMLAFDILHMMVALESFHGCLLVSCAAPPSSWATEDDPSYTIFLFNLFTGTRNPSPNQFFVSLQQINQPHVGKRNATLHPLLSSPLI